MRYAAAAAVVGTALIVASGTPFAQTDRTSDSLEREFAPKGRVNMDLSAGEYRISSSRDHRIRMRWSVRSADQLSSVKARADIRGLDAKIVTDGPTNHFKVDISVPAQADLFVRLTAGELRITGIEGNKDVELHAGELDIDVGRAEDYKRVDASLWAGELRAAPFGAHKEGLFRSFDWYGKGSYRLHARLKAGEIRLHSKGE